MTTTAEKLQLLINTKSAIKSAIIAKGQPVADNDTFASYANKILSIVDNTGEDNNLLQSLQEVSLQEFQRIKGIGKVKAIQLKAVCELARRMALPVNRKSIKVKSSADVAELLMEELRFEKVEYVKLLLLNSKNIIVRIIDISKGGMNSAIVEPKEVLQEAIKAGIPKIILVHNHPSRRLHSKSGWYRYD